MRGESTHLYELVVSGSRWAECSRSLHKRAAQVTS